MLSLIFIVDEKIRVTVASAHMACTSFEDVVMCLLAREEFEDVEPDDLGEHTFSARVHYGKHVIEFRSPGNKHASPLNKAYVTSKLNAFKSLKNIIAELEKRYAIPGGDGYCQAAVAYLLLCEASENVVNIQCMDNYRGSHTDELAYAKHVFMQTAGFTLPAPSDRFFDYVAYAKYVTDGKLVNDTVLDDTFCGVHVFNNAVGLSAPK